MLFVVLLTCASLPLLGKQIRKSVAAPSSVDLDSLAIRTDCRSFPAETSTRTNELTSTLDPSIESDATSLQNDLNVSNVLRRLLYILNQFLDKFQALNDGGLLDTVIQVNKMFVSFNRVWSADEWRKQLDDIRASLPGREQLSQLGLIPSYLALSTADES
jgi:hypothetical protein